MSTDKTDQHWLIEILLPLAYNDGSPIGDDVLSDIRQQLVDRFGGLTAFTRSPAEGVWTSEAGAQHDDVVVLELMAPVLDRPWWRAWRKRIETLLDQEEIVVRATRIERV
jgi:hypothetical protein